MAEWNDARRSIEASRAHLTEIAEELSRRTSGDYLKDRAREAAMRRASRARDAAMSKASDVRDRASSSPAALGTLGALTGGALGLALGKKAKNKRQAEGFYEYGGGFRTEGGSYVSRDYVSQPAYVPRGEEWQSRPEFQSGPEVSTVGAEGWSEPYREQPWRASGPEAGWSNVGYGREGYSGYGRTEGFEGHEHLYGERIKDKASEIKGRASEKASELKGRVAHKASDVKHRIQEKKESLGHGGERMAGMKEKAAHLRERIPSGGELRKDVERRPIGAILGGLALGALAASLLPLTRKERKVMHPAKERMRSEIGEQVHNVEERLGFGGEEQKAPQRDWGAQGREWQASRGGEARGFEVRGPRGGEFRAGEIRRGGTFASSTEPGGGTFSSSAGEPGTTYSTSGVGAPTGGEVGRQGTTYGSATSNLGTSGETSGSSWGAAPDQKITPRESIGAKGAADAPYRQPSLDQQLDERNKEKDKFH
jgi:hypothetical protein